MTYRKVYSLTAIVCGSLLLTACAAPDISTEISRTQTAMGAIEKPVGVVLSAREASALSRQINSLIAAGEFVYVPSEACYLVSNSEFTDESCTVEEAFQPSDDVTRLRAAEAIIAEMKTYFDALAELAASDNPEKIAAATKQLFADLDTLSNTLEDALPADVNARIQKRNTSAPMVLQFAAEQARSNAIRRAVLRGDDAVEIGVLTIIAFLREADLVQRAGGLSEIDADFERVELAREANDPAAYAAALAQMQSTIRRVENRRRISLEGKLIELRLAHRAIAEKVLGPVSLEGIRDATETVAEIQQAIQTKDQS